MRTSGDFQETPASGKARVEGKAARNRVLFQSAQSLRSNNACDEEEAITANLRQQQVLQSQSELSPDSRELFDDLEEAEIAHLPRTRQSHPTLPLVTPALVRNQLDRAHNVVSSAMGGIPDSAIEAQVAAASSSVVTSLRPTPNQRLAFSAVRQPQPSDTGNDSPMQTEGEEKSAEELMAESERLAMQLMQEEETLLCERIQQEQMRVIAEMRRNRRLSGGDRTESNDLDVALRLAEQEDGDAQEIDVDEMSYDELLELGEDIGDVKQERWRIEGRAVVSALRVVTYEAKADQADLPASVKDDESPKCVVCQCMYAEQDKLKILPCGHAFHADCIDVWLKDHDTCVTCKRSIKEEEK